MLGACQHWTAADKRTPFGRIIARTDSAKHRRATRRPSFRVNSILTPLSPRNTVRYAGRYFVKKTLGLRICTLVCLKDMPRVWGRGNAIKCGVEWEVQEDEERVRQVGVRPRLVDSRSELEPFLSTGTYAEAVRVKPLVSTNRLGAPR
jgi:hypothetical protein